VKNLLIVLAFLVPAFAQSNVPTAENTKILAFTNGNWFDGHSFKKRTGYSVRGILSFRRPAQVDKAIDLAGGYVVCPFGEAHNHNVEPLNKIDALIQRLNQSLGITVVIVTHDLTTLFTICRRIAVLVDRKIIVGTLAELMRSDQPWVHEFLHGPRAQGAMTARKHSHGNG